jgi:hypothetical protein
MSDVDQLIARLHPQLVQLSGLLNSPRHLFSTLKERDVPQTAGLYVIYSEQPVATLYVGKARTRTEASAWGQPDGLCFRIMKNHLGYQGDDNFFCYLADELQLSSKGEVRDHIRKHCSVSWIEIGDIRQLFFLEHLAIAAMWPRLNRG